MLRRTMILLLAFSAARLVAGCCKDIGYPFRWTKATLQSITLQENGWMSNLSDSIKRETGGFALRFEHERLARLQPQAFGPNAAWALKCVTDYENIDTIASVQFLTRFAFDAAHPAGSSLNDLPLARNFSFPDTSRSAYQRFPDAVSGPYGIQDFDSPNSAIAFAFGRTQPFLGQHRFVVRLTTLAGRVLEDSVSIRLY